MLLSEIQPNLKAIIQSVEMFADVQSVILIDDGAVDKELEDALIDTGLVILICDPQGLMKKDTGRGVVSITYALTVWLRTNPKVRELMPMNELGGAEEGRTEVEFYGLAPGTTYHLTVDGINSDIVPAGDTFQTSYAESISLTGPGPRWNPLACEEQILRAVLRWSRDRADFGFVIPDGLEPETDMDDRGNHSRLLLFSTNVVMQ